MSCQLQNIICLFTTLVFVALIDFYCLTFKIFIVLIMGFIFSLLNCFILAEMVGSVMTFAYVFTATPLTGDFLLLPKLTY